MKRLLLFLILALSAHGQILAPILGGSSAAPFSCAGYLICQNFETPSTGYDNGESWSNYNSATTVNPAYTTSPLLGTQSLRVVAAAGSHSGVNSAQVTAQAHLYTFGLFTVVTAASGTNSDDIFEVWNAGVQIYSVYREGTGGTLTVWDGSNHTTATAITVGTKYWLWTEYNKSGTVNVWLSSTSTMPGSPTLTFTTSQAVNANQIALTGANSSEHKFDHVLVSTSAIGSNP